METKVRKTETRTLDYIKSRGSVTTRISDVINGIGISKASALSALKNLEKSGIIIPVSIAFNSANYVHKNHIEEYKKKQVLHVKVKTIFWDFVFINMSKRTFP